MTDAGTFCRSEAAPHNFCRLATQIGEQGELTSLVRLQPRWESSLPPLVFLGIPLSKAACK